MFKVLFHRPEGLLIGTFAALIVCGAHFKFRPAASKSSRPNAVLRALGRELNLARFAGMG